jgi:short-subunit dehydrogenase
MNNNKFLNWDNLGTAIITGASSGIGAEFAHQLAKYGFNLILVARRKNKLDTICQDLSNKFSIQAESLVADLSDPNSIDLIVDRINDFEDLDVLINNAGYGIKKPYLDWENHQNREMINVHYTAPVRFCHAALQGMMNRERGIIINNASISAIIKSGPVYGSSKTGLIVFTEILKGIVNIKNIHIQALCPGFTYSEFHDTELMNGFNRADHKELQWQTAEEVVSLSLQNLKSRYAIFIPGEQNRALLKSVRKTTLKRYLDLKIL